MADNIGTLNAFTKLLQTTAEGKIDQFGGILLALATVGVLAFAIIELIKALPARQFFNGMVISSFIKKRVKLWEIGKKEAQEELEKLAIGGRGKTLYMLPIEKLAGQINAAAQTALAYPDTYRATIKVLASLESNDEAVKADINTVVAGAPDPSQAEDLKMYTAARTRVSSLIQRNLDNLQIRTNRWWTLVNQGLAIVISVILVLSLTDKPENYSPISWFFTAVFAGMIAPVAKDILAKLKKPGA